MSERVEAATSIVIEVAPGELIDKLTILQIKSERIDDPEKLRNVRRELEALTAARRRAVRPSMQLDALTAQLKATNEQLWEIEDAIRRCEAARDFSDRFVELARSVYRTNDRRSELKRQINELLGSTIVEEKDYQPYD